MLNQHFLKTLIIFASMILVGLLGVFLVSYFESNKAEGVYTLDIHTP